MQPRYKEVQDSSQVLKVAFLGDDMSHITSAISPILGIDFSSLKLSRNQIHLGLIFFQSHFLNTSALSIFYRTSLSQGCSEECRPNIS
jgi:hypothetical protein